MCVLSHDDDNKVLGGHAHSHSQPSRGSSDPRGGASENQIAMTVFSDDLSKFLLRIRLDFSSLLTHKTTCVSYKNHSLIYDKSNIFAHCLSIGFDRNPIPAG